MQQAHYDDTSNWCYNHYCQQVGSQKFETFHKFGKPKDWPIKNLQVNKIAIFHGDNDDYNRKGDIQLLRKRFQKKDKFKLDYTIPCSPWIHNDYMTANDAGRCYIGKVLQLLNQL